MRGGQIEPGDIGAGHGEVGADLARSAADIGDGPTARQRGDPLEQPAVERLAVELVAGTGRRTPTPPRRTPRRSSRRALGRSGTTPLARRGSTGAFGRTEPVDPARLLLPGLARQLLDQRLVSRRTACGERPCTWSRESKSCRRSDRERSSPGVCGPAQQEQGHDGALGPVEPEHLVEHLAVLRGARAVARVDDAGETLRAKPVEPGLHLELAQLPARDRGPTSGCTPSAPR